MISRALLALVTCTAAFVCTFAQANVFVPAGAALALNAGELDLGSTDLQIGGSMALSSGTVGGAHSIAIGAGGVLNAGSGTISLFGDWTNLGTFSAGTGTVNFIDGTGALSTVSGNSTFHDLSFVSTTGKTYAFAAGSTQTIGGLLTILGTAAVGIQFKSTTPGQVAFIDLLPSGSQNIAHVGVSNVHATGQPLAPTQTNDGGSGDALGWFGSGGSGNSVAATPALSAWGLLLLLLSLPALPLLLRRRFSH